jgi:ferrous iron transport protein B
MEQKPEHTKDKDIQDLRDKAESLRIAVGDSVHDSVIDTVYSDAAAITGRAVRYNDKNTHAFDYAVDRILTSKIWSIPIMFMLLTVVFWLTIQAANYPSALIAEFLFAIEDILEKVFTTMSAPWWLTGFFVHGVYRALAWVISVMLPPMAIFFPCFTLLEDIGYLPRVAFNTDKFFQKVGASGKQALTMSMGFGCNAAGIIATRIIESPRERLIAIVTNNFVPCNGRWPTLIMLATVFIAAAFPSQFSSIAAASSLVAVTLFGILVTLVVSAVLSKTLLKGEASSYVLELPPYRRPQILRVLYTSLIDRTIFVMWRAILMAAPCGGLAWLLGNISVGGTNIMSHIANALYPVGYAIGLDGVILLAYIIAIPANEIVVPTIIMAYMNMDRMTDIQNMAQLRDLLVIDNEWTVLTAVCLMLFSLLHNPCSTTIFTIYKETNSTKWTLIASIMPVILAFAVCFVVAQTARILFF